MKHTINPEEDLKGVCVLRSLYRWSRIQSGILVFRSPLISHCCVLRFPATLTN